jgi:inner membrane protein
MLGYTHIAIALTSAAIVIKTPEQLIPGLAAAAAGSLLPDIDTPGSTLRYHLHKHTGILLFPVLTAAGCLLLKHGYFSLYSFVLYLTYIILAFLLPHRTFTHSILGFAAFMSVFSGMHWYILLPAAAGYGTHLLADLLTPAGIPVFYPLSKNFKIPLVRTGSISDILTGTIFWAAFVVTMFQKLT